MKVAPYIAAAHVSRAAHYIELAVEELSKCAPHAAYFLSEQAAEMRLQAAQLEARAKAESEADEASARAYDLAHPV